MNHRTTLHSFLLLLACTSARAGEPQRARDDGSQAVLDALDASRERYAKLARELWNLAEVGYQEERSCALLAGELERAGFTLERGVAGMPTAFVASFGSGEPVLGVLGEFDALPGMSQTSEPSPAPAREDGAGHACGHNLFGPGSLAAVIAVKDWMSAHGTKGTLRYYGTPAVLTELQAKNMRRVGGVQYSGEEQGFAERLARTLPPGGLALGSQQGITPPEAVKGRGSTDVGDVSWVVPTTEFYAATWVPGTPPHTWQAVAASGTTIGEKGMLVAAKTLALTLIDLLQDPTHVARARAEFEQRTAGREYAPRIGDRPPPLDYRKRP